MKRATTVFGVLIFVLASTAAQGQASRTWVSGVGDDANPCSRTAPCKTWPGAISKTQAKGVINALDPGGFGGVTITKSITIDGTGQLASGLNSSVNGVLINAASTDIIVLRDIDIHGALVAGADGVRILNAAKVILDNVRIQGQSSNGIEILPGATPIKVIVRNCQISDTAANAIQIGAGGGGAVDLVVENTVITGSASNGIVVNGNNTLTVVRSTLAQNTGTAIQVEQTNATANLVETVLEGNGTGIVSGVGGLLPVTRITRCTIVKNGTGISGTGTVVGFQSNMIATNGAGNSVSSSVAQQ